MTEIKPVFPESPVRLAVTAVIVLYRIVPEQSPAFSSVMAARAHMNAETGDVHVLLWDNTPSPGSGQNLPQDVAYLASERNSGLATAYNRARRLAAVNRSQWLLTLDQDTAVPLDFFVKDGVGHRGRVPATRASALSFRRSLREQSNSRQIGFSSARSRAGGVADTSAYRLSRCSRSTLERC